MMKIEELLLKKEELPILFENCFQVPIHPRLLNPEFGIDMTLANRVFPQAADEWYQDLSGYAENLKDEQQKEWIRDVFLKTKPKITKKYGRQQLNEFWEDDVLLNENGFARSLSISRNSGGTLYHNGERECEFCIPLKENGARYVKFSEEKIREFAQEIVDFGENNKGAVIQRYLSHNIDYYPGALFLRNWAILYLNKAMRQVFE